MTADRYAILVGTSKSPLGSKLGDLVCPEHDVDGLREVLTDDKREEFTEILVLKNSPNSEIMRAISMVLSRANKDDFVLIYYSGYSALRFHAELYLTATNTEIWMLEATAVSLEAIMSFIRTSHSTSTALVLDCVIENDEDVVLHDWSFDNILDQVSHDNDIFIMSSATKCDNEVEQKAEKNSIIARHLIEGLKSESADPDRDGIITMYDIYLYIDEIIKVQQWHSAGANAPIFRMHGHRVEKGNMILSKMRRPPEESTIPKTESENRKYTKIEQEAKSAVVRVFFATDRNLTSSMQVKRKFGIFRGGSQLWNLRCKYSAGPPYGRIGSPLHLEARVPRETDKARYALRSHS